MAELTTRYAKNMSRVYLVNICAKRATEMPLLTMLTT